MGRRSQHTPEELRELILGATRHVVETQGFEALSAREIAREIGYAPGTLYNMFANLDDILMRVQTRVLEDLDADISKALENRHGLDAVRRFAATYVEFAFKHPKLWTLIQQHVPQDRTPAPDWYLERLYAPMSRLEPIVGSLLDHSDAEDVSRSARMIWSAIHGTLHVATTDKFGALPMATTVNMIDNLVAKICQPAMMPRTAHRETTSHTQINGKRARQAG